MLAKHLTNTTQHRTNGIRLFRNTPKYQALIINELQNTHNDKNGKIRVRCCAVLVRCLADTALSQSTDYHIGYKELVRCAVENANCVYFLYIG